MRRWAIILVLVRCCDDLPKLFGQEVVGRHNIVRLRLFQCVHRAAGGAEGSAPAPSRPAQLRWEDRGTRTHNSETGAGTLRSCPSAGLQRGRSPAASSQSVLTVPQYRAESIYAKYTRELHILPPILRPPTVQRGSLLSSWTGMDTGQMLLRALHS
jgi:hypothetical protein